MDSAKIAAIPLRYFEIEVGFAGDGDHGALGVWRGVATGKQLAMSEACKAHWDCRRDVPTEGASRELRQDAPH